MEAKLIPFDLLPVHDTCWSLISGPDRKAYAAACCEFTGGVSAFVVRYDPSNGKMEYLIDVAEAVGEPVDNGRATQCKIHYSLLADDDGILYGATHLSGPPAGDLIYNPWANWHDPVRSYIGSKLFAFDLNKDRLLWTDTLIPWEGCRALALDRKRRRLYAVGYPRNHFYEYDLNTRRLLDLGRIGSVNPQAIFLDSRDRAYTTDDWGRIVRYDPDTHILETLDAAVPHPVYQNGFHCVLYDVVGCPDGRSVIGIQWNTDPHFFRYFPEEGPHGKMIDLGPAFGDRTGHELSNVNEDHIGGLVFDAEGWMYYGAQRRHDQPPITSELIRMNIETGERQSLGPLVDGDKKMFYVSRAVRIGGNHLILGLVGPKPLAIGHVTLPDRQPNNIAPLRYWG